MGRQTYRGSASVVTCDHHLLVMRLCYGTCTLLSSLPVTPDWQYVQRLSWLLHALQQEHSVYIFELIFYFIFELSILILKLVVSTRWWTEVLHFISSTTNKCRIIFAHWLVHLLFIIIFTIRGLCEWVMTHPPRVWSSSFMFACFRIQASWDETDSTARCKGRHVTTHLWKQP